MVSIVIPVFDRPELLEATLASVLEQSHEAWECLLVDDGSGPETLRLVESVRERDDRVRVLRRERPPKGASTCRNIGKEAAAGRYVLFLDSDDLLAPWCLAERTSQMEAHPGRDAGLFQGLAFREELFDLSRYANKLHGGEDLLARYLAREVNWHTTSPLWRKEFVSRIAWDERASHWQDREFHIRAILEGPRVFVGPTLPDYFKRTAPEGESVSAGVDELERVRERAHLYERLIGRLPPSHRGIFREAVRRECEHLVGEHSVRGRARHERLMQALMPLRAELSIPTPTMRVLGTVLGWLGDQGVPAVRGALLRLWLGGDGRARTPPARCPPGEIEEMRRRLEEGSTAPRRWP